MNRHLTTGEICEAYIHNLHQERDPEDIVSSLVEKDMHLATDHKWVTFQVPSESEQQGLVIHSSPGSFRLIGPPTEQYWLLQFG